MWSYEAEWRRVEVGGYDGGGSPEADFVVELFASAGEDGEGALRV